MNRGEFQNVEALFQKCFAITDSVELCRLYVSYVRRVNDVITGGEKSRGIIIQAFEFAITKVGIDIYSDELWNDYLEFLKSWTPTASWEQQQKTDLIRKVYKKFLIIPTKNIETSWQQYSKWENEINQATANKFIAEKSSEFMLARSWNIEWFNIIGKGIKREMLPYSTSSEYGDVISKQLKLWLKWIELEKKNNLELKDAALLEKRILYTFEQATLSLPFVPELWFKFSKFWLLSNEEANLNKCIEILSQGLTLNPKSFLISFQIAELFEKDNTFEKAKETYLNLINNLDKDYQVVKQEIDEIEEKTTKKEKKVEEEDKPETDEKAEDSDSDSEPAPIVYLSKPDFERLTKLTKSQQKLINSITLVYTRFMVSSRRSKGIKEARLIFKLRKNFPSIGYQFYVENALLEHYADNKKTALKIFDLAFKTFVNDGDFLMIYLAYLININDVDNIRKVLQTSDTSFAKEIAPIQESLEQPNLPEHLKTFYQNQIKTKKLQLRKLYKRYITYTSNYLTIDVTNSFVNKYEQLFPEDDPVDLFTDRYRIGNLNLIKSYELNDEEDEEDDEDAQEVQEKVKKVKKRKMNPINEPVINSNGTNSNDQKNFVPPSLRTLLGVLPNASYFSQGQDSVFSSEKLVQFFSNLSNIPLE